jgi:glycopeptide antibiotics resistance protein
MIYLKMTMAADQTKSTLGNALLIYMLLVVVLITLIPFDFRLPEKIQIHWSASTVDIITNIFFFIPVGFLFRFSRRTDKDIMGFTSLGFGIFLSLLIETAQIFVPGRYTQIIDVATNGLGAWLGSILYVFIQNRVGYHSAARVMALELPLMNIVYLLIPLMWLNGLALGKDSARLLLMIPLGLMGGLVQVAIYIHRFKNGNGLTPNRLSLFAFSWFIVAALPALFSYPVPVIIFGALIAVVVQISARVGKKRQRREKRFELPTLKKILPLYSAYLLLMTVWPTTMPFHDWQFSFDLEGQTLNERIVFIFRFIEGIAAFTLLGYIFAEMRGRRNESIDKTLGWTLFITAGAAVAVQILRGIPGIYTLNLVEIFLLTAAGLYGAVIYRLQLSAIRCL